MLFSSTVFIFIFLPAVLTVYYLFKGHRCVQNVTLCLFSLFFYAWGEPKFVLVMMASICVNWAFGILVDRKRDDERSAKTILAADLAFNLAILFVFKYLAFSISSINDLLFTELKVPDIALPIGISFFTFQAISYVIDVYRRDGEVQTDIVNVALYISFFPQLIAGPIVRYSTIAEQIRDRRESYEEFSEGVVRFVIGLGKKVIIANNMALVADAAFGSGGVFDWFGVEVKMSSGMAWIGAVAYAFQIFFDFSGYSDMAIGLGKMFGFRFLENFNYPYISASITEFWRRWHISLGTWFRDYLYIPLGGSRCSRWRNYLNLLIVWLCTGIWHGANWTFVAWGLMYCVLLMVERATGLNRDSRSMAVEVLRHIYTLFFVLMGWVLFRSDSIAGALSYISCMFTAGGGLGQVGLFYLRQYAVYFVLAVICSVPLVSGIKEKLTGTEKRLLRISWNIVSGVAILAIFLISVSFIVKGSYNPFIYFNF